MEEIILKYLERRQLSQEEQHRLGKWMEETEGNRMYLSNLANLWGMTELDISMAKYRVGQRVMESHKETHESKSLKIYYPRIAAAVLMLVCSIVLFLSYDYLQPPKSNIKPEVIRTVLKKANLGEKLTIKLPDGTTVKLNSGSEIRFLERFDGNERLVEMQGEAFFDVVPDKSRPFIIESKNIIVKVVGTSFNVKAYPDEERMSVAVKSGIVEINDPQNTLQTILKKQQQISICEKEKLFRKEQIKDEDLIFGWINNNLTLDDLSLSESLRLISKWYGVSYEIKGDFDTNKKVTAKFDNPPLNTVMKSISHAYGFEYELNNKQMIIK